MRRAIAFCLLSCLIANPASAAPAASGGLSPTSTAATPEDGLSAEQMDNLLAPIALYPDPLLAQVIPASTFVEQIDQAARWLRSHNDNSAGVDDQPWDVSVRSVAHYPQIIYRMSEKLDWTTALGQAYVNQSTDVLTSVQRLRARAKSAGNLASTPQQTVIVEQEVIKIVPAQPQVIYVPTYNPEVVYVQSGPSTGAVVAATAISFGVGLAIGAWLNNDCNWHSHTVFYHGWRGTGWVSVSSRHVHVNSIYVNRSYANIHVNRAVVNRNLNYNNISHYNNVHRNVNYNNVRVNNVNRNNINTNNINRNNVNNKNLNRNINTNNPRLDSARGHTSTPANRPARQPAQQPRSAFGGYGNRDQTRAQSQRGQTSRGTMNQSGGGRAGRGGAGNTRSAPRQRPASGGRGAGRGGGRGRG